MHIKKKVLKGQCQYFDHGVQGHLDIPKKRVISMLLATVPSTYYSTSIYTKFCPFLLTRSIIWTNNYFTMLGADFENNEATKQESHLEYYCFLVNNFISTKRKQMMYFLLS